MNAFYIFKTCPSWVVVRIVNDSFVEMLITQLARQSVVNFDKAPYLGWTGIQGKMLWIV